MIRETNHSGKEIPQFIYDNMSNLCRKILILMELAQKAACYCCSYQPFHLILYLLVIKH